MPQPLGEADVLYEKDIAQIQLEWSTYLLTPGADPLDKSTTERFQIFNRWRRAQGLKPVLRGDFVRAIPTAGA